MITIDTKKYIDEKFRSYNEIQKIVAKKNTEALEKAEKEMNRRLEGMNEFREQLDRQTREFIKRDEYMLSEKLINQKIDTLSKIVYIGVGVIIVLEIVLNIVMR
jgi:hypothetical protein